MASLRLERISKSFGRVVALTKMDLDVEDGEFCVILGPSGCGKSTLLQIVAGLTPQDEGSVILDGSPVDHLAPRERDVAMVFQSYALYPHMSVAQNLGFGLRMRGVSRDSISRQVTETAQLLGIENLLNRRPKELSGGQRQRVAMGRALVRRPRLFLLDEPLSNLDARLRINVRVELKRLHQKIQSTTLYVTHDQVEAMTLGDRIVVMVDGNLRQVGTPENVYEKPSDTFVATFIGSPVMNLFKGKMIHENGGLTFRGTDFSLDPGEPPSNLEGSEVEVGIRPEDIEIGQGNHSGLRARVEMISDVGAEKYIHARLGATGLTVRAPKEASLKPGEEIPLIMSPGKIHLFLDGRRIS